MLFLASSHNKPNSILPQVFLLFLLIRTIYLVSLKLEHRSEIG